METKNVLVPYVVERTSSGERTYDLYSRLLDDRIIFLSGEINDAVANTVVAQLIYLEGKDPTKDISLYINSPGGSVSAGMAIYGSLWKSRPYSPQKTGSFRKGSPSHPSPISYNPLTARQKT